jgi:hypothetical protein
MVTQTPPHNASLGKKDLAEGFKASRAARWTKAEKAKHGAEKEAGKIEDEGWIEPCMMTFR